MRQGQFFQWRNSPRAGTRSPSSAHLGLAVLLNPAEDACRELLETCHRDGGVKGLEQGIHNALEHIELHLVGDLVLPLIRVVLMSFHNLLVVPETKQVLHGQQQRPLQGQGE